MRNCKGYSLLEVIISIAIIAVLVPSLFAMYMSGFGWVDESSARDKEALNFQSNYDNAFSGKSFTMITKSASTNTVNLFGHDIGYYELKPNSSAKVYHLSDDLVAYMYKTGGAGGSGTPYTINVTANGIDPPFSETTQTYTVPKILQFPLRLQAERLRQLQKNLLLGAHKLSWLKQIVVIHSAIHSRG